MRFSFTHSKTGKKCSVELHSYVRSDGLVHLSTPTMTDLKRKLDGFKVVGKKLFIVRAPGDATAHAVNILKHALTLIRTADPKAPIDSIREDMVQLLQGGNPLTPASAEDLASYTALRGKFASYAEKEYDRDAKAKQARIARQKLREEKELRSARMLIARHEAAYARAASEPAPVRTGKQDEWV